MCLLCDVAGEHARDGRRDIVCLLGTLKEYLKFLCSVADGASTAKALAHKKQTSSETRPLKPLRHFIPPRASQERE